MILTRTAFCILLAVFHLDINASNIEAVYVERGNVLDFDTAVNLTLNNSLTLNMANLDASSRQAENTQAKLFPNPIVSYEIENFAGNKNWNGFDNREERISYSQLLEMGGKRDLRIKTSSYQYLAALVGYESSKLQVLNRLNRAFIKVVAIQEFLQITQEQTQIAFEILNVATSKVEAGKVSLIQQNKAEVAHASAELQLERAKLELKTAKRKLALIWRSTCPDFDSVDYPFFEITPPIPFEACLAELCNQPEIVQSLYYYFNAHQNWRLEKANRIPDVVLSVGYKAEYHNKERGLLAAVSVPIPVLNQNQGNIRKAYCDLLKTGDQGRELWLILESKLAISYEELERAYNEAEKIKNSLLKSVSQSFELAHKGYREGKLEYIEVLDAQRTLFDVKEKYIQALVNYHNRRADIDYLNTQTD